jgi:hypothetical protein
MPTIRTVLLAALLTMPAAPSFADSPDETITRWYTLLVAANEEGLAKLLSDDVKIKLTGVDVTQNKAQFLGAISEWRIAIAGGGIEHKLEKTEGDTTTVRACYDFADNDILMRETFRIADGLIVENTQTQIGEDCSAF